jgi:hypothetical protein
MSGSSDTARPLIIEEQEQQSKPQTNSHLLCNTSVVTTKNRWMGIRTGTTKLNKFPLSSTNLDQHQHHHLLGSLSHLALRFGLVVIAHRAKSNLVLGLVSHPTLNRFKHRLV